MNQTLNNGSGFNNLSLENEVKERESTKSQALPVYQNLIDMNKKEDEGAIPKLKKKGGFVV